MRSRDTPPSRALDAALGLAPSYVVPRALGERLAVRRGLRLPRLSKGARVTGSVWAVGMMKNERDIVETTLRHLMRQDVDQVLVVDNGSTDGTAELLRKLSQELPLHVGSDREPRYFQAPKMNALAQAARRAGADWVVPFDADELWFASGTTLGARLRATETDVITAHLFNAFPTPDGGMRLDLSPHFSPKVAFRAHRWATLAMGNHTITHPGARGGDLFIAHLPWRSRAQLEAKGRQGAAALTAHQVARGDGRHWSQFRDATQAWVDEAWADLLSGRPRSDLWWSPVGPFLEQDPRDWNVWPADVAPARDAEGSP